MRQCATCPRTLTVDEHLKRFARCRACRRTHVKAQQKPGRASMITINPEKAARRENGTADTPRVSFWVGAKREQFTATCGQQKFRDTTNLVLRPWTQD